MSRAYRLAGPAVPSTVSEDHKSNCTLHGNEVKTPKCGGLTVKGHPCENLSVSFRPPLLPVCKTHRDHDIPAGRCQAPMGCGQVCDRIAKANPPFNFCDDHGQGSPDMPCFLTELPPETLIQIIGYLAPDVIPSEESRVDRKVSLRSFLKLFTLNRKIGDVTKMVLYKKTPFEVDIDYQEVRVYNRWLGVHADGSRYREEVALPYNLRQRSNIPREMDRRGLGTAACMVPVLQKVRNIRMSIHINAHIPDHKAGFKMDQGIVKSSGQSITVEDYGIIALRDSIRLFIRTFRPRSTTPDQGILDLEITPLDGGHVPWGVDETVAGVVLATEPLKHFGQVNNPVLHSIIQDSRDRAVIQVSFAQRGLITAEFARKYRDYKAMWQSVMARADAHLVLEPYVVPYQPLAIQWWDDQLASIRNSISKIYENEFFGRRTSTRDKVENAIYHDIYRLTYLASLAREQKDVEGLLRIRDALLNRWINHQRIHQRQAREIGGSLLNMYNDHEQARLVGNCNYELVFTQERPLTEDFDPLWPELPVADFESIPRWNSGDQVSAWGDKCMIRRHYRVNGKYYTRLRTPRLIRELRDR